MDPSNFPLNDTDLGLIRKYFKFYFSIDNGSRKPTTPEQDHFLQVCRGLNDPATEHELAYIRLRHATAYAGFNLAQIADDDFALLKTVLKCDDFQVSNIAVRLCIGCKRPIPPERLEALPNTEFCTSCQERAEKFDWHISDVSCPRCAERGFASPLVWRIARDPNLSGYFLSCSRFPVCRYLENSLFDNGRNRDWMPEEDP